MVEGELEIEIVGDRSVAGILADAAVDGVMSCSGEGSRLIWTDWMAEASSVAGLADIVIRRVLQDLKTKRCWSFQ